jgi:hypothetical protein
MVMDTLGQGNIGNGQTNLIDNPPSALTWVSLINTNNSIDLIWSSSVDDDYYSYTLFQDDKHNMNNKIKVFETTDKSDTTLNISVGGSQYFELIVTDIFSLSTSSRIVETNPRTIIYESGSSSNSDGNGPFNIHSMDTNGLNKKQLTNTNDYKYHYLLDISKGGGDKKILYSSSNDITYLVERDVFIMDIDGNNPINLTSDINGASGYWGGVLSIPEVGKAIVTTEKGIYSIDFDGSNSKQLTTVATGGNYIYPDKSPEIDYEGNQIIYSKYDGNYKIYTIDIEDGEASKRQLTDLSGNQYLPKFSNNEKKIVFKYDYSSLEDPMFYSIDIDGTNLLKLDNLKNVSGQDNDRFDYSMVNNGTIMAYPNNQSNAVINAGNYENNTYWTLSYDKSYNSGGSHQNPLSSLNIRSSNNRIIGLCEHGIFLLNTKGGFAEKDGEMEHLNYNEPGEFKSRRVMVVPN